MRSAKITVDVTDDLPGQPPVVTPPCSPARIALEGLPRSPLSILVLAGPLSIAIAIILVWGLTGPIFHFSDTWQLIINTGTTIVTFLMVFLIQNTQNRDARAIHLKLNELIHAMAKAKNQMIDVEKLSDLELEELAKTYEQIRIASLERRSDKKPPAPR